MDAGGPGRRLSIGSGRGGAPVGARTGAGKDSRRRSPPTPARYRRFERKHLIQALRSSKREPRPLAVQALIRGGVLAMMT